MFVVLHAGCLEDPVFSVQAIHGGVAAFVAAPELGLAREKWAVLFCLRNSTHGCLNVPNGLTHV